MKPLRFKIRSQLWNIVVKQVSDQVYDQVWTQIEYPVGDHIYDQVRNQIILQVKKYYETS